MKTYFDTIALEKGGEVWRLFVGSKLGLLKFVVGKYRLRDFLKAGVRINFFYPHFSFSFYLREMSYSTIQEVSKNDVLVTNHTCNRTSKFRTRCWICDYKENHIRDAPSRRERLSNTYTEID